MVANAGAGIPRLGAAAPNGLGVNTPLFAVALSKATAGFKRSNETSAMSQ
jgi:hypothetical protein